MPHVWSHSAFQTAEQDPRFCAGGCSASHGTGQQPGTSLCCRHHAPSLASPASQQPQLPFWVRDLLRLWIKCVFSSGTGVRMHCEVLLSLKEEAFKKLRYLGHREKQNKTNKQKQQPINQREKGIMNRNQTKLSLLHMSYSFNKPSLKPPWLFVLDSSV